MDSERSSSLSARVTKAFSDRADSLKRGVSIIRSWLVVVGGGVATFAQFTDWPETGGPSSAQIAGIVASIVVTIGGLASAFIETDAAEHLALAQEALMKATEMEAQAKIALMQFDMIDDLEAEIEQMIELYQSARVMRNLIEASLSALAGGDEKIASDFLALAGRSLAIATGFQQSDRWTISLYKAFPGELPRDGRLKCIASKRAIDCELGEAREWSFGKGVTGVAYMSRSPVVVPNMQAPELQAIIGAADSGKEQDIDRYRSMAAFPIFIDGNEEPWGVATATNDRHDHFNHADEQGLKSEEAIRLLAEFMGLALGVLDSHTRSKAVALVS